MAHHSSMVTGYERLLKSPELRFLAQSLSQRPAIRSSVNGTMPTSSILGRYGDVPDDLAPFHVGLMISRSSLAGAERLNLLEIDAPSSRA
jgi:hypothetical protein